MTNSVGARRPALMVILLASIVAAVLACIAWAQAGGGTCPYYTMGTDGSLGVDGMMPPNYCGTYGGPGPKASPSMNPIANPHALSERRAVLTADSGRTVVTRTAARPIPAGNVWPPRDITLTQNPSGRPPHKYAGSRSTDGSYLITRDGESWATVRYNRSTKTWDFTDPNGTGYLILRVGANPHRTER